MNLWDIFEIGAKPMTAEELKSTREAAALCPIIDGVMGISVLRAEASPEMGGPY